MAGNGLAAIAIVAAVAGLMLSASLQPAFAHGRTTITFDEPPVQGKQVRPFRAVLAASKERLIRKISPYPTLGMIKVVTTNIQFHPLML